MQLNDRIKRACPFALLFTLCLGTAGYAIRYLLLDPDLANSFDVRYARAAQPAIGGHFFYGGAALAIGPLQLLRRIRQRWPQIHRTLGLLYTCCVGIAGVSALAIAPQAATGAAASAFTVLAMLWLTITGLAWQRVLVGDFEGHARWMCRSIALTSSAVTLRIILGLGIPVAGLPFDLVYGTAAWSCWIINLLLCELLLRRTFGRSWESRLRDV